MSEIPRLIRMNVTASHGTMTVILAITRMVAMSSMAWWVAPSGPTEIPA